MGLNFEQYNEGITIDNDHYIEAMELPFMDQVKHLAIDENMDSEDKLNSIR